MYYTKDQLLNTLRITVPKIDWISNCNYITAAYWDGERIHIYELLKYGSRRRIALGTFNFSFFTSTLKDAVFLANLWGAM